MQDAEQIPDSPLANKMAAAAMNMAQAGRICRSEDNSHDLSLLTKVQAESWATNGFFVLRGLVPADTCSAMSAAVIDLFNRTRSEANSFAGHHQASDGVIAIEEAARMDSDADIEQRMSKVFNLHRQEPFRSFARHPQIANVMHAILGPDVSCFNSQYIFKNPGVWGQPWHQDSLYYLFNEMPQVGVWLATSRATVENGCLFVAPGSHREPIHEVVPDARPGANFGYMEVVDYDFGNAEPVLMEAGDVLIFHSFLMHKSNDNTSDDRRSALVYHYARSTTEVIGPKSPTIDFMPVLADGLPMSGEA